MDKSPEEKTGWLTSAEVGKLIGTTYHSVAHYLDTYVANTGTAVRKSYGRYKKGSPQVRYHADDIGEMVKTYTAKNWFNGQQNKTRIKKRADATQDRIDKVTILMIERRIRVRELHEKTGMSYFDCATGLMTGRIK